MFKQKVALFGFGYWGKILHKVLKEQFYQVLVVETKDFIDAKADSLDSIEFKTKEQVLSDSSVQLCFVATPEETHFSLVRQCLRAKKHTFVEKPLCLSFERAKDLIDLAAENLNLYVDCIFLLDQAFEFVSQQVHLGQIGSLIHVDSYRYSCNINRKTVSVLDDLMIHDLYLSRHLTKEKVKLNSAFKQIERDSLVRQALANWRVGDVSWSGYYSWDYYQSQRKIVFHGSRGKLIWSKTDQQDLVKIYEYKQGQLELKDRKYIKKDPQPLTRSINYFVNLIKDEELKQRAERYQGYKNDIKLLEIARKNL
jgi:predicted dehydrogenase